MKILFPSWTGHCVKSDAWVEIVKDFVDLVYLIVDRSWASEAGEGY